MDPEIRTALNNQAMHELLAAASYTAMSLWCRAQDYDGFGDFFAEQAAEEREHADKIFGHLLDRGEQPTVEAVAAPRNEFGSLCDVAEHALYLEQQNTAGINDCYALALAKPDYPSQALWLWFISEQVEEEAWASKMVNLTRRAECAGSVLNLDRHISKILADDE